MRCGWTQPQDSDWRKSVADNDAEITYTVRESKAEWKPAKTQREMIQADLNGLCGGMHNGPYWRGGWVVNLGDNLSDADVERLATLTAEIAEIKGRAQRNQERRELKARLDEMGSEE
jgi:hypothetical protein